MKINKLLVCVLTGFMILSLINCNRSTVKNTEEFRLTETGITYEIPLGGIAVVELEENASTGYSWQYFIENEDMLSFDSDKTILDNTNPALVGAPIKHEWKFKALEKGTTSIKFAYLRSWEIEDTENLDRKSLWDMKSEAAIDNIEYIIDVK